MKFGLTHRVLTSSLAALGVLAIVLSGALPRVSVIVLVVGLVAALLATERFQLSSAARYSAAIVPSAVLGLQFLRFVGGATLLELAVEFAAALQIVRIATRRGATHDQQVIVLSLVHLVAGTVLGGGIAYGLCLFGFLVLAPGALVLSHLRREVEGNYRQGARDRTGLPVDVPRILRSRRVIGPGFLAATCLLSLPIVVFTALLFLLFPRVGLYLLFFQQQRALRTTGFSDTVDLGGIGAIRSDPAVVLRFRLPQEAQPPPKKVLWLRGTAFDEYRGGGLWSRSTTERYPLARQGADVSIMRDADPVHDELLRIELEPMDPTVLFLPPRAVAIRWAQAGQGAPRPPPVARTAESTIRYETAPDRVLRYDVFIGPRGEMLDAPLTDRERARYLQLPKEMPGRVRELATQWTRGARSDLEKARMISGHLESEYRYTLEAPSGGKSNPIDDFLFRSRAGHCEFFSSSMAILLRSVGVPTRNVSGFVGGTYNRFGGFYAVRQGDAHSWVEAWVDVGARRGWMTFDPTPAAGAQPLADTGGFWVLLRDAFEAISQGWDHYVVGYDLPTQWQLFQRMHQRFERTKTFLTPQSAPGSHATRRWPWILSGIAFVSAGAGLVLLLRRRRRAPPPDEATANKAKQQRVATELWLSLESALHAHGETRPQNVPTLRFAELLRKERGDEIGDETYVLASRYALARFGGDPLSSEEQREFARRVAGIRRAPRATKDLPPASRV